jgi:hypothetical protein
VLLVVAVLGGAAPHSAQAHAVPLLLLLLLLLMAWWRQC